MKLIALVVVFALAAITSSADAAPKPKNKVKANESGRADFEKGMRFFKAQEYEAAYIYLLKAYEVSGHRASTIRALAQCERSLKRYDEAIAHFREYLATTPKPSDSKAVEETIALLLEVAETERKAAAPPPIAKPAPPIEKPSPPIAPVKKEAPPEAIAAPIPPPPIEEEGGVFSSPVFWVIVGGAAVAGGAVALGVGLSGERDPYLGSTGVVIRGP